ncbi:MAG: hypothetical protein FJX64_00890 [Alphaproteobacteria bacterium]|nr:hypothetical protein [Alphaproteobacteria bacterium]
MLGTLRTYSRSWIFRGLLIVLAGTFALYFGTGGTIFSSLANQPVATVGDIEITQSEFAEAYRQRYLDLGGRLTPDQARQFGLPFSVLSDLVGGALVDNAARDLGIAVSDALLAADIRAQVGALNPAMYQSLLRQQGLTVPMFEDMVRRDLTRSQLSAAVAPRPQVPRLLSESLYRHRQQKRVVDYVLIPAADATDLPPPDDAALTEFYTANVRRYTAPEFRDFVFIALQPKDVVDSVRVTDAALAAEYQGRIQEFTSPDTRGLSQLFFATEAEATSARKRIEEGVAFAEAGRAPAATPAPAPATPAAAPGAAPAPAAQAAAPIIDATSIGIRRREDLAPEIAEAVFALPEGAISQPLRSAFGWHIYRVDSVQRGGTRPLAEVQEQLRVELAQEQALTELYHLSVSLDDALAAGSTLEQAAQKLGLKADRVVVDAQGRDRAGLPEPALPPFAQLLTTAFRTERGRESRVVDVPEGGYFVLRVDNVTAPAPIPLAEINDRVRADWIAAERNKRTEALAQDFLDKAKNNGDFVAYAAEAGHTVQTTPPFTRTGLGLDVIGSLSPQLITQMFQGSVGTIAMAPVIAGGYAVGRLKEIFAVDPTEAQEAVNTIRDEIARAMSNDILSAYQTALRARYGIAVNQRALDQALTVATQSLPTVPTNR